MSSGISLINEDKMLATDTQPLYFIDLSSAPSTGDDHKDGFNTIFELIIFSFKPVSHVSPLTGK